MAYNARRLANLYMDKNSFLPNKTSADINIAIGGQFGFSPSIDNYISEKAYVRRSLVILVLEAPKFMSLMNKSENRYACLRAVLETQPSSVTGFNATLTVALSENEAGGGGETQQDYTNVTRERSAPTFEYTSDRSGNIISKFFSTWITYGLMDPKSKIPLAATLDGFRSDFEADKNWLADWYACSYIAIEPNETYTEAVNAWLVTNSYPTSSGDISGTRNIVESGTVPSLSIPMTALSDFGQNITDLGTKLLRSINYSNNFTGAITDNTAPYLSDEDANMTTASGSAGYSKTVNRVTSNQQ